MRNRPCAVHLASILFCLSLLTPRCAHAQGHERTLHEFGGNCWEDDQNYNLISGLVADSKGDLYGARACGAGLAQGDVFEISYVPGGRWHYSIIYTFPNDGLGGVSPQSGLTIDKSGDLYGTTYLGGANDCGVVYELTPNSSGHWTETVLYNFGSLPQAADGCNPLASVVFDHEGNLYGTTSEGGTVGPYGVAFELSPNSNGTWSENVLHNFGNPGQYGVGPNSSLVFDSSGNLYGTTPNGGQYTDGTVFELSPTADGTWTQTLIHQFSGGSDGSSPYGVVFDSSGNLYGSAGGPVNTGGEVYRLSPDSDGGWSMTVLHTFPVPSNTAIGVPGRVSFNPKGILYGPLDGGGASPYEGCPQGCGAIFRLIPGLGTRWSYQRVYAFTGLLDGGVPMGPLIFDAEGNVYGTTLFGGDSNGADGDGTIFQITAQ